MNELKLEQLEVVEQEAWREYEKLQRPAAAAHKKWQAAAKANQYAVLYLKVKRQVMRELISAAGRKDEAMPESGRKANRLED